MTAELDAERERHRIEIEALNVQSRIELQTLRDKWLDERFATQKEQIEQRAAELERRLNLLNELRGNVLDRGEFDQYARAQVERDERMRDDQLRFTQRLGERMGSVEKAQAAGRAGGATRDRLTDIALARAGVWAVLIVGVLTVIGAIATNGFH